jgi:hypothetical protein
MTIPRVDARTVEFLSLLGYLYLCHGQAARAIAALEAVRIYRRDDPQLVRSLAYAYLSAERFADCLSCIDSSPMAADRGLQLIRSRALWGLGRHDEARRGVASITGGLRGQDGR